MIIKCIKCGRINKHEAFNLCRKCYSTLWAEKKRRKLGKRLKSLGQSEQHRKNISRGINRYYSNNDNLSNSPAAGRQRAEKIFSIQPCAICKTLKNIHRHHKDKNPINNNRENIVFLCSKHHNLAHFIRPGRIRLKPLTIEEIKVEVIK